MGLGSREARVYLACLELGKSNVSQIQKSVKLSRSTTYYILQTLIEIGLIVQSVEKKKKIYIAENPDQIDKILIARKEKIDDSIKNLHEIIPNLAVKKNKEKFLIKYYQGENSIHLLHKNLYNRFSNQQALFFSSLQDENKNNKKTFNKILSIRLKNKVSIKGISPMTMNKLSIRSEDNKQLRESRFIPKDKFPFESDILIFPNLIVVVTFDKNNLMAIVIEDEKVYKTMKMIFQLSWEAAEKYDKEIMEQYRQDPDFLKKLESQQEEISKK